jgi:hypothetical protein
MVAIMWFRKSGRPPQLAASFIWAAMAAQRRPMVPSNLRGPITPDRPSNGSLGDASRPRRLGKRHLQLVAGESARFKFRKVSDIGQHSGTLCALQTATGGLRCPGLKQRPQALFGLGALWRLACPNFRLSQRPLSCPALASSQGSAALWCLSNLAGGISHVQRATARVMPRGPGDWLLIGGV